MTDDINFSIIPTIENAKRTHQSGAALDMSGGYSG